MSGEEVFVNVERVSTSDSDDEWIDVGADESLGTSELESGTEFMDDEGAEGASGHTSRKGHHNELEKKRRRTLNNAYASLNRMVKRINPKISKIKMGRDKTLEMALNQVKESAEKMKRHREEAQAEIEQVKKARFETDNEEKRKVMEERLRELGTVANRTVVLSNRSEDEEEQPEDDEGSEDEESCYEESDDPSSPQSSITGDNDDVTPCPSP